MVGREVAKEKNYLANTLKNISIQYPIGEGIKSAEVEKFASNLQRRMERRSTAAFRKIRISKQWLDTVEFLKYHRLERYTDAIIEYHDGYLTRTLT